MRGETNTWTRNVVVACIMGDTVAIVDAVCMDMSKVTKDAS